MIDCTQRFFKVGVNIIVCLEIHRLVTDECFGRKPCCLLNFTKGKYFFVYKFKYNLGRILEIGQHFET